MRKALHIICSLVFAGASSIAFSSAQAAEAGGRFSLADAQAAQDAYDAGLSNEDVFKIPPERLKEMTVDKPSNSIPAPETVPVLGSGSALLPKPQAPVHQSQSPSGINSLPRPHVDLRRAAYATEQVAKTATITAGRVTKTAAKVTVKTALLALYLGGCFANGYARAYNSNPYNYSGMSGYGYRPINYGYTPLATTMAPPMMSPTIAPVVPVTNTSMSVTAQRIGNYTYTSSPAGMSTTSTIGNTTYTNGPGGTTTANTIGAYTYIHTPDGATTTASRIGNNTYLNGPSGQTTMSQIGNTTYVNGSNGLNGTIQQIGNFSYGNFRQTGL